MTVTLSIQYYDSFNGWFFQMISKKTLILSSLAASTVLMSACSYKKTQAPYYWQRASASSALYLQGPKAQQMLHQDIAKCTAELKELGRMGDIRRAIPTNYNSGNELNARTQSQTTMAQNNLDEWDTPSRDGYLLNEHNEFHDFETCMISNGWERAEYLPFDDAARARSNYEELYKKRKRNITSKKEYVRSVPPPATKPASYENTND